MLATDTVTPGFKVSCLPAGTVSGAPKVRALQIIDEALQGNGRTHRADLLFMKGLLHREMGQNDLAVRAFEEAQNNDPALWLAVRIAEQLKIN